MLNNLLRQSTNFKIHLSSCNDEQSLFFDLDSSCVKCTLNSTVNEKRSLRHCYHIFAMHSLLNELMTWKIRPSNSLCTDLEWKLLTKKIAIIFFLLGMFGNSDFGPRMTHLEWDNVEYLKCLHLFEQKKDTLFWSLAFSWRPYIHFVPSTHLHSVPNARIYTSFQVRIRAPFIYPEKPSCLKKTNISAKKSEQIFPNISREKSYASTSVHNGILKSILLKTWMSFKG